MLTPELSSVETKSHQLHHPRALLEDGFGKEPKLEQGFGHIPHAIEVKLTKCSWHLAQFGKY